MFHKIHHKIKQVSDTTDPDEDDYEDDNDSERLDKLEEEKKPLKSSLKVRFRGWKGRLTVTTGGSSLYVQVDHSGCENPPVDTKTNVAF